MGRSYKLLPKARLDLETIFHYISEELVNPEAAFRLITKFETKFISICEYPKANPVISNPLFHHSSLRKTVVDKYVIVYIFDEGIDLVNIVRVIYARQDYYNEI